MRLSVWSVLVLDLVGHSYAMGTDMSLTCPSAAEAYAYADLNMTIDTK